MEEEKQPLTLNKAITNAKSATKKMPATLRVRLLDVFEHIKSRPANPKILEYLLREQSIALKALYNYVNANNGKVSRTELLQHIRDSVSALQHQENLSDDELLLKCLRNARDIAILGKAVSVKCGRNELIALKVAALSIVKQSLTSSGEGVFTCGKKAIEDYINIRKKMFDATRKRKVKDGRTRRAKKTMATLQEQLEKVLSKDFKEQFGDGADSKDEYLKLVLMEITRNRNLMVLYHQLTIEKLTSQENAMKAMSKKVNTMEKKIAELHDMLGKYEFDDEL